MEDGSVFAGFLLLDVVIILILNFKVRDVMMSSLRQSRGDTDDLSDEGDW